jgi:ABC-type protease/lipase transport system fused ATPase/permease subunit
MNFIVQCNGKSWFVQNHCSRLSSLSIWWLLWCFIHVIFIILFWMNLMMFVSCNIISCTNITTHQSMASKEALNHTKV